MAIVITGKSKCPVCNEIINKNDDIVLFPPFVQNTNDPFYFLNDSAVHVKCLLNHELGKQALEYKNIIEKMTSPKYRICDIGGNLIKNPNDYIFFDLLTSAFEEKLSLFNFMTIDKKNIHKWNERQLFLNVAKDFISDGKWQSLSSFNYLSYLIDQIGSNG